MRKLCPKCRYETLVYPPDHTKCSGCGKLYRSKIRERIIKKPYDDMDSYDELITYQRRMARDYPYYPIEPKDWNKIHPETITAKGLEHLEILRSEITMGRAKPEDIVIFVNLLELYVCSNPTLKRLRNYKKELDFHFDTLLRTHYYPDLKKEGLVIYNEKYSEKIFFEMVKWGDDLIKECYRVAKEVDDPKKIRLAK